MINRNQNKIYTFGNNQNKRILIPQNKQMNNMMNQNNNIINSNQKAQLPPNANYNNRNIRSNFPMQNQNSNLGINNENEEVGKALLIIRRELKKKDDKIMELEKKVQELTNQLKLLTNNKNNFNMKSNATPFKEGDKEEYNNNIEEDDEEEVKEIHPGGINMGYAGIDNIISLGKNNIRDNKYIRSVSHNNPNYNSDNENRVKRFPGYDNLSHSNDNSVLTYNGNQSSSKKEVKNYLKEVKSKIEPKKFKEFIRNIKLLTAKNNSALNKNIIIESVKILFGEEHKDLFIRFQTIVGVGK